MNADESRRSEYVSAVGILHDGQNLSARNLHEAALKRFKKARTSFQVLGVAVEVARCDLEIANSYYAVGDLARAKASYKRANNGYVDKKMNFEAAQCEAALGKVAIDIGNFDESLRHYKTSTELFLSSGNKVSAAKSQMNRGDAHYYLMEYDSAESHYLAARKVFEEGLRIRLAAKCTLGLAEVALARRQYNEAERLVRSAWLYFQLDGGDADKAACDQALGGIYLGLREFAKARIYISSARRMFIECGDKYGVAECELDLATIDYRQQNWESARSRYFSELEQFSNLGNRASVRVLAILGEWKAAVEWEREGVKYHQDSGNIRPALPYKYNVAMILYESAEFQAARHVLVALLGEAKRAGDEYWAAYCQLGLGYALIELGSSVSARKHIIEAQHTFVNQGVRLGAADCSRALGLLSSDLGEYGLAVRNFEDARRIYLDEGDHLKAALCDVLIARSAGHGWSLGGAQPLVLMCRKELRGVIGNLIWAIRYLSSIRFQFPTSHERLQWVDRISSGLVIAYWWAQKVDDEKLISDLIEFQINDGVHGVGRLADWKRLRRFGPMALGEMRRMALGEMQGPSSGSGGEVGAVSESLKMSGEDGLLWVRSQLIPGAILPMLPPPELKFPDGHLAFEDWHSQVGSRICSVIDRMHAVSIE